MVRSFLIIGLKTDYIFIYVLIRRQHVVINLTGLISDGLRVERNASFQFKFQEFWDSKFQMHHFIKLIYRNAVTKDQILLWYM